RQVPNLVVVFYQEDRLTTAGGRRRVGGRVTGRRAGTRRRQVHPEGRPLPRLAGHFDVAAALLDDAVDGGQPQPGPRPRRLGGEEGLEDVRQGVGVHAAARVADGEQYGGGCRAGRSSSPVRADRGVRRLQGQGATLRHRVPRVDGQVEDHLLKLAGVGLDRGQVRGQGELQLDILADHAPQHAVHVLDDGVEVQDLRR